MLQANDSKLEFLNLSRNGLGFKTGAHVLNLLVDVKVKERTKMRGIDLTYNNISKLL
jgi:Ran GTPase-activating protein (RanGAP) involved in mRNA processing and transport